MTITGWLPPGKRCAIVFTVDDVHPGRSSDPYEAGGDLSAGALGRVEWLLARHPDLRVTLFVTPDWREISPVPTRRLLARIPWLRDRVYLASIHPKGTMRLDRHQRFVEYIKGLQRVEVGLHGLHHVHRGPGIPVEFQNESREECEAILREALSIFGSVGLSPIGMTPPGWNCSDALARAMDGLGLAYVQSARDIITPVEKGARTAMSGRIGVPLTEPEWISGTRLVHFTSNFQATSDIDRAFAILDQGGLLAIKAHIIKNAMGSMALDGMDDGYRDYLDRLLSEIRGRYGDSLWWTSMEEIARRIRGSDAARPGSAS